MYIYFFEIFYFNFVFFIFNECNLEVFDNFLLVIIIFSNLIFCIIFLL